MSESPAYARMLATLFASRSRGVKLDLDRLRRALAVLENPEWRMGHVVHIAGTNGKGSTAAMIESMLRTAGLRTGLFTSPHLCRFSERIRIAGAEASEQELCAHYARMSAVADDEGLTFFEQVTLLAVLTFADAGTDVVVLEVGLGGRLDASNVIDADVAVLTQVALDHREFLGDDLASIAAEKAGIVKAGRVVVVGAGPTQALLCGAAGPHRPAEIVAVDQALPADWSVGLPGAHQRQNAATALAAVRALASVCGLACSPSACRAGLASARWPGRCERIEAPTEVWLDAAHNPDGATALAAALQAVAARPLIGVMAVSADKDAAAIAQALSGLLSCVVATQSSSPRAMAASELAERVGGAFSEVLIEADARAALAVAQKKAARGGGAVVVFGSLFLVGALRAELTGEKTDPIVVQDPLPRL